MVGEGPEHAYRRLVETPLQLAHVRVGQVGQASQLSLRQLIELALRLDEAAETL